MLDNNNHIENVIVVLFFHLETIISFKKLILILLNYINYKIYILNILIIIIFKI